MSVNLGTAYAELTLKSTGFTKGIQDAQSQLKTFETQANLVASGFKGVGSAMEKTGGMLTKTVTAPIVALGTAAVKTTATFDQSMSKVSALSGATGKEFDALRNKAIEMGAKTAFSASESADALSYMALAGWDTQQMIAGLPGVLDLAAASQMDLAEASDIVTDFLTAFGLEAEDAITMADQMSYAQANSNTTTRQLGDAFGNCAAQMHTAGQSMETTTAFLEAMANQGLKGSEAGTALSAVMRDITQKMDDGAIAIGDVAVEVMDADGNFRNLVDIMADVEKATEGMGSAEKSAALMTTFTARSIKAVSMSLTEGTDNIRNYESALYDVSGTAGEQASKMLDNLNGQLTLLKSAIETLLIQIGDLLMPYIKQIVERIQGIVEYLTSLSEEEKIQIGRILAIAAAIGPLLLVGGKLLTGIGNLISTGVKLTSWVTKLSSAFGLVSGGATTLSGALAGIGAAVGPILAVIAAVAALGVGLKALYDQGGQFTEAVDRLKQSIGEDLKNLIEGAKQAFEDFKNAMQPVIETIKNSFDFGAVDGAMAELVDAFLRLKEAVKPVMEVLMELGQGILAVTVIPILSQLMGLINGLVNALAPLINVVTDIVNIFTDQFTILSGLIKGLVTGDFSQFIQGITDLKADSESLFFDMISTIQAYLEGFLEGFGTTFDSFTGGLLTDIGQFFSDIWNEIVTFFTVTIPEAFNTFVNETIPNFIESVKQGWEQLPYTLGFVLGEAMQFLLNWGTEAIAWVQTTIPQIIEGISQWFQQLPGRIYNFLHETFNRIVSWGVDMRQKATEIATAFFNNMIQWFQQLPGRIQSWIATIPGKIMSIKGAMLDAGKAVMNALWDGLKSVWDSISSWFEGVVNKVKEFVQGIKDGMSSANSASSGSHADGLSYVPYNGYRATLHEGERILTRNEAEAYNRGTGSVINNFYSPKAIDAYEANRLFKQTVRQMEEGFA